MFHDLLNRGAKWVGSAQLDSARLPKRDSQFVIRPHILELN